MIKVHFSDFFDLDPQLLEDYGAFDVSLVNDLPLFIDSFLIFNSDKAEYQNLHNEILKYLKFLRDKSLGNQIDSGLLKAWYLFGEVKQNWLGYSKVGNKGSGLGPDFASALHSKLGSIFANFGDENITKSSHLEKLCLVSDGVGRDNISDFTTNLIKEYLLEYTQNFARKHIDTNLCRKFMIAKVRFNYNTETWESKQYELPYYNNDFVVITPKDILTKDDIWISKTGLTSNFHTVASSVPNEQLRSQINNYFYSSLSPNPKKKEIEAAINHTILQYPQLIEYYIRYKEDNGEQAQSISKQHVVNTETLFVKQVHNLIEILTKYTSFYNSTGDTYDEAFERVMFLKSTIEYNDGYRYFYLNGTPIKREEDLQILYRLTWYGTPSDVNREVNNGRGPVDYKVSRGSKDNTLVEFKLASNSQLKRNLENQVQIYQQSNNTKKSIKVILYFTLIEFEKVSRILRELKLESDKSIVLIDARNDNKPSASKAKQP